MKKFLFIVAIAATVISCKGKSAKTGKKDSKTTTTSAATNNDGVVAIDLPSLKDEAAYLQAWEKFTTARMADEQKQKEDKSYSGHYTEYLEMYTALLKSTTAFTATLPDASARVAFGEKVSAIQNKMYAK